MRKTTATPLTREAPKNFISGTKQNQLKKICLWFQKIATLIWLVDTVGEYVHTNSQKLTKKPGISKYWELNTLLCN